MFFDNWFETKSDPTSRNNILSDQRRGTTDEDYRASTSIWGNVAWDDLTAAPLDGLNRQLKKVAKNVFVNPLVLFLVVAVVVVLFFVLRKKL